MRVALLLLVFLLGLVPRWLAGSVCPAGLARLAAHFPPDTRIASLFSGAASLEARLAATLGREIDAYDVKAPVPVPPGIRFIQADLSLRAGRGFPSYDRVVMWSPWIAARRLSVFNADLAPPEIPFSSGFPGLVQVASRHLLERLAGFLGNLVPLVGEPLAPEAVGGAFAGYTNRELIGQRLHQLLGVVAIARDFLREGGQILVVTELVHTLALSLGEPPRNHLLAWSGYEVAAREMLAAAFPGIRIERNPGSLRAVLLPEGSRTHNPWGEAAVEAWVFSGFGGPNR